MSYIRLSTRPFLSVIEKKWIAFQLMSAVEQARENLFYVLTLIVFRESSTNLKTKYRTGGTFLMYITTKSVKYRVPFKKLY